MGDIFGFAGFGVSIFAFISEIISISLEYWMYKEAAGFKTSSGLWKTCSETAGTKICSSNESADVRAYFSAIDALRAVQAMVILGLMSTAVAVMCGALKLFVMKDKNILTMAAAGLLGVAGLFLMIGFAVYDSEIYQPIKESLDLHAGFAFCIIAWLACWIAAALFGLVAMKKK